MAERAVHGVLPMSNFGGLEISVDDGAEQIFWRQNYGEPGKWHRAKIHYPATENGIPYFIAEGRRIHLNDVLRVSR